MPRWRALSSSEPTLVRRWRIDFAYDGTQFHGFAAQPGQLTISGSFRAALARTLRLAEPPELVGAGRTDTGVHAFAQVVHVDLAEPLFGDDRGNEIERLVRSLNSQLAPHIVVQQIRVVPDSFHARYSAQWRSYRYLVIDNCVRGLEFTQRFAWCVPAQLDETLMNEAASSLIGNHDFRSFCRRPSGTEPGEPLRRDVTAASWSRVKDAWGLAPVATQALRFDITANAFCQQMVRSLTSSLVAVGSNQLSVTEFVSRLSDFDRRMLPAPAPPGGLCLMEVGYDQLAGGPSGFVR